MAAKNKAAWKPWESPGLGQRQIANLKIAGDERCATKLWVLEKGRAEDQTYQRLRDVDLEALRLRGSRCRGDEIGRMDDESLRVMMRI